MYPAMAANVMNMTESKIILDFDNGPLEAFFNPVPILSFVSRSEDILSNIQTYRTEIFSAFHKDVPIPQVKRCRPASPHRLTIY